MKTKECAACGDDLTHIVMPEDYRMVLYSTYEFGGDIIDDDPSYFCGLGCLKTWVNKETKPPEVIPYRKRHADPDCERCFGEDENS